MGVNAGEFLEFTGPSYGRCGRRTVWTEDKWFGERSFLQALGGRGKKRQADNADTDCARCDPVPAQCCYALGVRPQELWKQRAWLFAATGATTLEYSPCK